MSEDIAHEYAYVAAIFAGGCTMLLCYLGGYTAGVLYLVGLGLRLVILRATHREDVRP